MTSLPSRERGLKSQNKDTISKWYYVAPFAGAWIEIAHTARLIFVKKVAPFAGAWIEIDNLSLLSFSTGSLPSRERGLKYCNIIRNTCTRLVAPFAGAWIEIYLVSMYLVHNTSRSLRGSVD